MHSRNKTFGQVNIASGDHQVELPHSETEEVLYLKFDSGCLPSPLGTWPENPGDCDAFNLSSVDARSDRQPSRKLASGPVPMFILSHSMYSLRVSLMQRSRSPAAPQ